MTFFIVCLVQYIIPLYHLPFSISSKHNSKVVEEITEAIGTEKFSEDLIQSKAATSTVS